VFFRNNGGLGTLNAGEITKSHHPLREDLVKAAYASYACELLDRVLHDEETGSFWFRQLTACLNALEEDKEPGIVINVFEMKVLQAAGYGPQLDTCVVCDLDKPAEELSISPRLGGVLCRSCRHNDPPALEISPRALKLLRVFAALDLTRLGNVDVKADTRAELKTIMRAFMDVQLGLRLKSQNFLDQLDKYNI
jgi:DNA repair protein RecO (recombination protein O)